MIPLPSYDNIGCSSLLLCCHHVLFFLVEVLRDPPESLSVALPLQDRAHEELEGPAVELGAGDLALARSLKRQQLICKAC